MLTFDTSGNELYVTKNNPKTLNSLIRRLKVYYKDNPDVDPYKMAYELMPSQAASCPDAKQQYINDHFCYADKFAILTNGLGIVRHIAFLDDKFKAAILKRLSKRNPIPRMKIEDKSAIPLPRNQFSLISSRSPAFRPDAFLGDSAFDTIEAYGFLKDKFHFSKALISYNPRNESTLEKISHNVYGYPTYSKDSPPT